MALRPGRPRKQGVERTASGRISRKKADRTNFFAVYVAAFPCGVVKVGRTCDVQSRMMGLKSLAGEAPIVCAEFHVGDMDDSIVMERHAIAALLASGYERDGREWFHMSYADLPAAVAKIARDAPVHVARIVKMGHDPIERSAHDNHRFGVTRMLSGHRTHDYRM